MAKSLRIFLSFMTAGPDHQSFLICFGGVLYVPSPVCWWYRSPGQSRAGSVAGY